MDAIKTQWQTKPGHKNEYRMALEIYKEKGPLKGFYSGSLPSLGRNMLKSFYRYPLVIGFPIFYEKNLPNAMRHNKRAQKLFSGVSIALIESFIICPFERLKTYFMTREVRLGSNPNINGLQNYYRDCNQSLVRDLFKGIGPLIMRQMVAWNYFLQVDLLVK